MKIFKDYIVLIISIALATGIVFYDLNLYWPDYLSWMEGNRWNAIIPFIILVCLNIYFPLFDKKKRSIREFYKDSSNTKEKKRNLLLGIGTTTSVVILTVYLGFFYKWPEPKVETVAKTISAPSDSSINQKAKKEALPKPEVVEAPVFSEKEASPFKPDIVILTKNLSDLPRDIVNHSFLSKIITKETMFFYEDDPQYLGLLGTVRRLSYEHNVELKDNVFKYLLSIPAEIALWRGANGKINKFLFIASKKSLSKNILSFYLKLKKIRSDKKVRTFLYEGEEGYYVRIGGQEIAIWNNGNKLYITNLHPKYFPDKNEKNLTQIVSKLFGDDKKKGFYKRLYNVASSNKHSVILNSDYLTFGYGYFIPSLKAVRLDFNKDKWGLQSLLEKNEQFKTASTDDLWKIFPKSSAMCAGLPVNAGRVSGIIQKYRDLTLKRIEEENKEISDEEVEVDNSNGLKILTESEIGGLLRNVVAACWYERSTIYTPLFITKVSDIADKKEKIRFLFDKFIGGLEEGNYFKEVKETTVGGITTFSRITSSKYGILDAKKSGVQELKFKKFFNVKLAFNDEYIMFSPDGELVDLAISTLSKKHPSISDELKLSNKNISYLLSPYGLSQLLDKYMKVALPSGQESVFRTAIESHLSSAFKNLSNLKSVGINMPKPNESENMKWKKLEIYDL